MSPSTRSSASFGGILVDAGFPTSVLTSAPGCYELHLPGDAWVDIEAAADAVHEAETALRRDDPAGAYDPSAVAYHIARRPFLAGNESHWAESRRRTPHRLLITRPRMSGAGVYLWNNEHALAIEAAREAVDRGTVSGNGPSAVDCARMRRRATSLKRSRPTIPMPEAAGR